ncbi:MAG: uridine kinase [Acidimicrobiia bacterium]
MRPFVVGVAGGSGSGKTTVAERLADVVGERAIALVRQDSYYCRRDDLSFEERVVINYDHPDAFDWPLLLAHVQELCAGMPIEVPVYDFAQHTRSAETVTVAPARVLVVEGILALYEPALRSMFDLKVFVDTDADVRFIRRLQRDVAERGRDPESVISQYLATVRPSHIQFIEPSKRYADVIIPHGGLNDPALEVLLARVRELVRA